MHIVIAWHPELELVHWAELVAPNHHAWVHPLTVANIHFYPRSAHQAAEEFRALIEPLLEHSLLAVAGGDFNTATATEPFSS